MPKQYVEDLPDEIVYVVANRFLAKKSTPNVREIAEWLVRHYAALLPWLDDTQPHQSRIDQTRQKIYQIIREAVRRGFVALYPPKEVQVAEKIWHRYHIDDEKKKITVVNVHGQGPKKRREVHEHVARASAQQIFSLVRDLAKQKGGKRIGIGLGAGSTAMDVAMRLGKLVSSCADCPALALHALTSGFSMDADPAPVTFFRFFDKTKVNIEFLPLFSAPIVRYEDYEAVKKQPVVREAFCRAKEIDIVVTSLARAIDPDGLLNSFLANGPPEMVSGLQEKGWVGDVQFLPYSRSKPIKLTKGIRAVTLFDLGQLVEMANADDKYVVLVAGPCHKCGELKTEALKPLLEHESLRMWSHVVTDIETAESLLPRATPPSSHG